VQKLNELPVSKMGGAQAERGWASRTSVVALLATPGAAGAVHSWEGGVAVVGLVLVEVGGETVGVPATFA